MKFLCILLLPVFLICSTVFFSISLIQGQTQNKDVWPSFHTHGDPNNPLYYQAIIVKGDGTVFEEQEIDPNNPPIDISLTRMFSISVENEFNDPDRYSQHELQKWAYTATLGKRGEVVYTWGWIPLSPTNEIAISHRDGSQTVFRQHSLIPTNIYTNRKGYPFGATIGDKVYFRTVILDPKGGSLIEAAPPIQVEVTDGWSWGEPAIFSITQFGGILPRGVPFKG